MDGLQIRLRPAGTGRQVEQKIGFARRLYSDAERTARDLHAASGHQADLAELIGSESFDAQTLTNADALLVGAGRLICELQQWGTA